MSDTMQITQQVPKSAVAKYVNDAMEMEINSYSLKQTAKNLRQEAKNLEWSAKQLSVSSESELIKYREAYNEAIKEANNPCTYEMYKDRYDIKELNLWQHLLIIIGIIAFPAPLKIAATQCEKASKK